VHPAALCGGCWHLQGDVLVTTALQLPGGMYARGKAAPTERLCLEELCYGINNREQCLELGLTIVSCTYLCFNLTASFSCSEKHPCNLQAGEKHLSPSFQVPGQR